MCNFLLLHTWIPTSRPMLWLSTCTLSSTHAFRKKRCLAATPATDVLLNRVHTNSQSLAQNTGQDNCSVWESIQACAYIPPNPWQLMHFKILPEWGYTRVEPEPDWARKCCAQPLWRLQASFCCTKIKEHQSRSHRYQKVPTELTWPQWRSW